MLRMPTKKDICPPRSLQAKELDHARERHCVVPRKAALHHGVNVVLVDLLFRRAEKTSREGESQGEGKED